MKISFSTRLLVIVLVVYVALAFAISLVTPFNKGPDEGINLAYIEFLAVHNRLPVTYAERADVGPKGNWPAFYHLLVAWSGDLLGLDLSPEAAPTIKIFWDSFRYRTLDLQNDETWFLPTEDFRWPFYGRILTVYLGRWYSIVFSTLSLVLAYLIAQELRPNQPWLALAATAILAFIPTYIFMGAVLNEDALVGLLAALYLWLLVRLIKYPEGRWLYWLIGLVVGLSVTVKYTTVVLPLEIIIVLAVIARRRGFSWRWWVWRLVIVGGMAIAASAWWFGWNVWFLNEVESLGLGAGILRPLLTGGYDVTMARLGNILSGGQIGLATLPENVQIGTFGGWVQATFLSMWGFNIGEVRPLWYIAYPLIIILLITTVVGLRRLWQSDNSSRIWLLLLIFHISIFVIAPLVRFWLSRRLGQTAQGRHILIPAAAAIGILLVWGLVAVTPRRWQRLLLALIIAGLVFWTGAHIHRLATFSAAPLPLRTVPHAAEWLSTPANTQFSDLLQLVSYELEPRPEQGLLRVELAWRSLKYVNENYLLGLKLVNQTGEIVSHWLGYNGQGRLPTLAWEPGDTIFDRLVLPLPDLPPDDYIVQVQLFSRAGPLPVSNPVESNSTVEKDSFQLADFSVTESTEFAFPVQVQIVSGDPAQSDQVEFALWRANGPVETAQSLPYRYPGTISIVTGRDDLTLVLVDPTGQTWPASESNGKVHTFVIGPRWQSGDYRLKIGLPAGREMVTEPILAVENWWERRFETPEIEVPLMANFANQLLLLGYKLSQQQVKAGESFPVTLYWQALPERAPQADFTQFNHVLDAEGNLRGGYDRRPLEYYSTLLWAPGEVVVDGYAVPVDADALPGEYFLDVGYYLTVGESAVNLPLVVDGQMTDISSVAIGPIEVIAP